jgi:hypothetical protein
MKVTEKYTVKSIDNFACKDWLINKHYAKRIPSISYAFGLFNENNVLQGCCTFGMPMAAPLRKTCFGGDYQETFLELNRLVVNENLEKNTLSFFVSQSLKMLPKPNVIVSYADSSQNHHGYIYQATNWYYSGLSEKFKDYMVKGYEHLHGASVLDMVGRSDGEQGHLNKVELLKARFGAENVYMQDRPQKHRYFYFLGDKKQVKDMLSKIKYPKLPYPKGDNIRYDASYTPTIQTQLF